MIEFNDEVQIIPQQTYFKVDREEISSMFEPDSILDKLSMQKLRALGGINGLGKLMRTNLKSGIGESDKELREEHFGLNDPIMAPVKSLMAMVCECFEDLMLQILCIATCISTVIGVAQDGFKTGWMEGFTIFLAVIIIVTVSAGNNYIKEKQFEKLNAKRDEVKNHAIREGCVVYLDSKQLLVGDIITIQIGDILGVDGILIEGSELQMDESTITGESEMINKIPIIDNEDKPSLYTPFLISGSRVMEGSGKMLVCTVGSETQIGKLKEKLTEEQPPTPLQQKLEGVAEDIGKIGTVAALLTMLALNVHLGVDIYLGQHCFLCVQSLSVVINSFLIAVTIVVVAVPEGLPLAVTIALAFSVGKMKDENNLVKQLSSCEIMGGATNICSDKTGTLTQNLMSVQNLYIDGEDFSYENLRKELFSKHLLNLFNESVCINSSAFPKQDPFTGKWDQIGNKTECALIELVASFGCNYQQYRPSEKIIRVLPFSSSRKKMTTIYQYAPSFLRIYVKGATEVILERCNRIITSKGFITNDYLKKEQIKEHIIKKYAGSALRTLGIAYKDIPYTPQYGTLNENFLESDLTLVTIAGIKDPLRPEIGEAIKKCKGAGIRVRMITGDNIHTAVAIAKDCGILQVKENKQLDQYEVLEGKQFRELVGGLTYDNPYAQTAEEKGQPRVGDFEMFKAIAKDLRVMARSTPDDKYILVTGLLQMNEVVAVTGDGTNDAPALKKADVGFAMGISGTEVAKEAAGIILLDDNFASIVTACKWGRNVYDSVRKFIQFQLTVNVSALFMSFMSSVVLQQSPLNSIEMLWVNIIMDTFASLALATEPPSDTLLERGPPKRNQSIISPNMWRNVFGQSIYQIGMLSFILFRGPQFFNVESSITMTKYEPEKAIHFTIFFQAFVLMQVFNEFNSRKLERTEINIFSGLFNNWLFWLIISVTFIVQYGLVQFGGQFVGVTPLTLEQHLYCVLIGMGSIIMGVLIKLFPNFLFNKVSLFKEDPMEIRLMDRSWTSMMRRRSSLRMNYHPQGSKGSVGKKAK